MENIQYGSHGTLRGCVGSVIECSNSGSEMATFRGANDASGALVLLTLRILVDMGDR